MAISELDASLTREVPSQSVAAGASALAGAESTGACAEPVVEVRGASYVRGGYCSFEFADLTARAEAVTALLSGPRVASRDLLLTVAGALRSTTGSIRVADVSFTALASGSSGVAGLLRGAQAWRRFGREVRARGAVGLGFFTGAAEVDLALTVEEAVVRELRGGRGSVSGTRAAAEDTLEYLARCGLATHADQRLERLLPAARARVSVALALASRPRVAVIDLRDPFCTGLTAEEERAVIDDMRALACETGAAVLVACAEAASAVRADDAVALDIAASEALASSTSPVAPVLEGADA